MLTWNDLLKMLLDAPVEELVKPLAAFDWKHAESTLDVGVRLDPGLIIDLNRNRHDLD